MTKRLFPLFLLFKVYSQLTIATITVFGSLSFPILRLTIMHNVDHISNKTIPLMEIQLIWNYFFCNN